MSPLIGRKEQEAGVVMWKRLTLFGILGSLTYALHVVLGGILWEGYNHLMQPISDLTAAGAPDRELLTIITGIYALFSIIFAVSALMYIRKTGSKLLNAGFILFLCMHLVSAAYNLFPEDLPNSALTFTGVMHIVVTGAVVPLAVLAPIFIGAAFRRLQQFKNYSLYSILTGIVMFVAGGITVVLMTNKMPYFGLFERINIGSLQLWMLLISLKLFTTKLENVPKTSAVGGNLQTKA
jgi:hypothetical protein